MTRQSASVQDKDQLLWDTKQVCKAVNIGPTTLRVMVASGQFPAPLIIGRRGKRWPRASVEDWIRSKADAASRPSSDRATSGRPRAGGGAP